jgi:hypothetical protein
MAFRYRAYGRFKVGTERRGPGATVPATHVAWELVNGPIPNGMCVLHRCDNPPCVRPDHLFLGTRRDNVLDMAAKGRAAVGERSGTAKLTASAVDDIRARYSAGETQRPLAQEYGVSQSTVSLIVQGRRWPT